MEWVGSGTKHQEQSALLKHDIVQISSKVAIFLAQQHSQGLPTVLKGEQILDRCKLIKVIDGHKFSMYLNDAPEKFSSSSSRLPL
jgi:hypothetical protein